MQFKQLKIQQSKSYLKIMKSTQYILPLDNDFFICLSSNSYYLNFIEDEQNTYRIDSDQKIIYFSQIQLTSLLPQTQVNHKDNIQNFRCIILFNKKLQWRIYLVKKKQQPIPILYGRINIYKIQNYDFPLQQNKASQIQIVNVHQVDDRILVIRNDLKIHNLIVNSSVKLKVKEILERRKNNNKQTQQPIKVQQRLVYPLKQPSYLTQFYLPQSQSNVVSKSLMINQSRQSTQNGKQNKKSQNSQLFLVIHQKKHHNNQKLNTNQEETCQSIYSLEINTKQMIFLSGKSCILNFPKNIINMHLIDQVNETILIHTSGSLYLLLNKTNNNGDNNGGIQLREIQSQYNFSNSFTEFIEEQQKNDRNSNKSFVGITYINNQTKIVKMRLKKQNQLLFQTIQTLKDQNVSNSLMYFSNIKKPQESYIFQQDYSLIKIRYLKNNQNQIIPQNKNKLTNNLRNNLKNISLANKDNNKILNNHTITNLNKIQSSKNKIILKNDLATIKFAKLKFIQPSSNVLYIQKLIGNKINKIIITNSWIQTHRKHYLHNLVLTKAKVFITGSTSTLTSTSISTSIQQNNLLLSSPLIGTLPIKITLYNKQQTLFKLNDQFKYSNQTLAISQSGKIIINPFQILFPFEKTKSGKTLSITFSKIFQGSTQYIQSALIFQKDSTFIFTLDNQLHVFEGNSQKTIKRKYIHCFNNNIKKITRLNDVNVFGIELYQNHTENDQIEDNYLIDGKNKSQNQNQKILFYIYILKQDKIEQLKRVNYDQQFLSSTSQLSFLSHINTVPYFFNIIYGKLVLVSSQQTHRYNPHKTQLYLYDFPFETQKIEKFYTVPLINLSSQNKSSMQNNFMLVCQKIESNGDSDLFFGSFSKKFLIKDFSEIKFNFQSVISKISLLKSNILFSTISIDNISSSISLRRLTIFTQNQCIHLSLRTGSVESQNIETSLFTTYQQKYKDVEIKVQSYKGLQKIQKPYTTILKQNLNMQKTHHQTTINNQLQTSVIVWNQFQVWYGTINHKLKIIKPHSFYSMLNSDFLEFRNNLSVQQLDQPEFMKIFSQKMPILQVKYISNDSIIVLYQKQITILEIGNNDSLNVKQEIKFSKSKENLPQKGQPQQSDQLINLTGLNSTNQYSQIKIIQLLGRYSEKSIYLKDTQSRLYQLEFNQNTKKYKIKFDRNLEEDIVCIGKTKYWEQNKISYNLVELNKQNIKLPQSSYQIVVKADSQLYIKDLNTLKEKSVYL